MPKLAHHHLTPTKLLRQQPKWRLIAVAGLFVVAGLLAYGISRADTIVEHIEAESGTPAGNYKVITDNNASGSSAVQFGSSTPAPTLGQVTGPIRNPNSNKCLDVTDIVNTISSGIRIWPCTGLSGQQWTISHQADGSSTIKALGLCLTVIDSGNYRPTQLQTCGDSPYQRWAISRDGQFIINLGVTPKTDSVGVCLDIDRMLTDAGTVVGVWDCLNNAAQLWEKPAGAPIGAYGPISFATSVNKVRYCLDLPNSITTPGTQLQTWECNFLPNQRLVRGTDAASLSIKERSSIMQKCLEPKDGASSNGTPVVINDCTGQDSQLWQAVPGPAGSFKMTYKSLATGKCMETENNAITNGAKILLRDCDVSRTGQAFFN